MAATIYALSYKDTGSILSFCMLEKQAVIDKPSASALRDRLVGGDNLVIGLKTPAAAAGFSIPKADICVDEVQIEEPKIPAFIRQPTAYVLSPLDDLSLTFGDGTPKPIIKPDLLSMTITMTAKTSTNPQVFTTTILNNASVKIPVYAFFAGLDPAKAVIEATTKVGVFTDVVTFAAGTVYPMVIVGRGTPTTIGLMVSA